jgi:hypothetical protein
MIRGVVYSTIVAVMCLAIGLSLVADAKSINCNTSQRFAYATPHVASQWKTFKDDLTPAQQQVIMAVLAGELKVRGPLGRDMNDRTLYFALPGHVLTLWFGEAASPTGSFRRLQAVAGQSQRTFVECRIQCSGPQLEFREKTLEKRRIGPFFRRPNNQQLRQMASSGRSK